MIAKTARGWRYGLRNIGREFADAKKAGNKLKMAQIAVGVVIGLCKVTSVKAVVQLVFGTMTKKDWIKSGAIVLAHPECPPDVLEEADFAGSTSALSNHVKESGARKVVLLTECSMSDNVAADNPGVEFVKPCNLCPHMKRISLENIYDALVTMKHEVTVPEDVRVRAKAAIDAMLALGPPTRAPKFKVGAGVHVPVELI